MPADSLAARFSPKRRLAVGVVVLLAAGAFLGFREWQTWKRLGVENDVLKGRIAQDMQELKVELPKARAHLANLQDEEQELCYADRLPDDDRLEDLFDRLSEFEAASKIDLRESASKEPKGSRRTSDSEAYDQLQYTLELRGGLFEFCRFMNLIETMNRFARVDEFNIRRAGKEAGADAAQAAADDARIVCDIDLVFSVFRLKPSAAPAKPAPAREKPANGRTARS